MKVILKQDEMCTYVSSTHLRGRGVKPRAAETGKRRLLFFDCGSLLHTEDANVEVFRRLVGGGFSVGFPRVGELPGLTGRMHDATEMLVFVAKGVGVDKTGGEEAEGAELDLETATLSGTTGFP